MDRPGVARVDLIDRGVERLSEHVVHVTQDPLPDRHRDRLPEVGDRGAADHPVGRLQRDRAHDRVPEVLSHLAGDRGRLVADRDVDRQRVVQLRELVRRELHVHHRTDHARYPARGGLVPVVAHRCLLTPRMPA